MTELLLAAAVPFLGWILYVERRLAAIAAIKEKLDEVNVKVERLVEYLIVKT